MTEFGNLLRALRQDCYDPDSPGRGLSQERLGEILGRELDTRGGYSGAAVSDWERGKSKIHADERLVLVSLIKILHELGGIKTSFEANELLKAGNYRALDPTEILRISFEEPHNSPFEDAPPKSAERQRILELLLERIVPGSISKLRELLDEATEGPTPSWPRALVALLRKSSDRLSVSKLIRPLFWLWIWLLTLGLIPPSLRWPFSNREVAAVAIKLYVGGSLVIPLLIGILTVTKHDNFWKEHHLANASVTRLYTYQGASIGFHLGYFGVFAINLLGYYIHLQSTFWYEWVAMAIILILGYVGARLVPYNLWRAYGRLELANGGIFFIFMILGPIWGYFFFEFYAVLLNSIIGGVTVLLAITLSILLAAWKQYRSTLP